MDLTFNFGTAIFLRESVVYIEPKFSQGTSVNFLVQDLYILYHILILLHFLYHHLIIFNTVVYMVLM